MSSHSTSTGDKDKNKRDRKGDCRKKIYNYFKSYDLCDFLEQKYAGKNDSENWWKMVGLGLDHVMRMLGTSNVDSPDAVKKAFSDAIFKLDAEAKINPNCVLAPRHTEWLRGDKELRSISTEEYAKFQYELGEDGMIKKKSSGAKEQRSPTTVIQGSAAISHQSEKARSSSPKSAPRVVIDLTDD